MTDFILNNRHIKTDLPTGMSLLNYIREEANLKGTKSGCKEGDCGACTVMVGELKDSKVHYKTVTSCIFPLGNAQGKHIVTVEGLGSENLNIVQQSLHDHNASQCGFCTPGIVISLSNYIISNDNLKFDDAQNALAGNICRCTGYKSIEKAAKSLTDSPSSREKLQQQLPEYFEDIPERLSKIPPRKVKLGNGFIAGGTDLLVQKAHSLAEESPRLLAEEAELKTLEISEDTIKIGASVTVSDFLKNEEILQLFPNLKKQFLLISSEQIRNMATFAGNLVNASPIGDLSIFLLACDAVLNIKKTDGVIRNLLLSQFYHGYKKLDLQPGEIIESIEIPVPKPSEKINFEKVSKRKFLDIASVNSCIRIDAQGDKIISAQLSAGGIGPVPFFAAQTSAFLKGKPISENTVSEAAKILNSEISPISDIRGSEKYKRLLLRQLFLAHFTELFPDKIEISPNYLKSLSKPQ